MSDENYKSRLSDKKTVSMQMSETIRFISYGVVALSFTIHSVSSPLAEQLLKQNETLVNLAALAAMIAIMADYCQYLAGYLSVNEALRRENEEFTYNPRSACYFFRSKLFWAKQIFGFLAAAIMIAAVFLATI